MNLVHLANRLLAISTIIISSSNSLFKYSQTDAVCIKNSACFLRVNSARMDSNRQIQRTIKILGSRAVRSSLQMRDADSYPPQLQIPKT